MDTRSQILRWREIVHPFFWPVFFWNLWKFAHFLRLRIEASGNGLITFEVTWWGAIRIYDVIDPDAPKWDAGLEVGAQRVHLATLDVGNPHLTRCPQVLAQAGLCGAFVHRKTLVSVITPRTLPPPELTACFAGTFRNLPHLDTS
ncbi:MAG: hypothetical protein AAFX86_04605 [Pseudomonadota bacterium]